LLPALLALLLAADLSLQFVLVVGALVHDRPLLPPDVSSWIRDVVGIDDEASGRQLAAALFRPVVMLTGLVIYRFGQWCFWNLLLHLLLHETF
jgi:hypothetical protein